nr:reverse transcriptase domain-containing protein [Tanacetum cinerariifolium]
MSAMANTTLIVTTVTKPATNPRDADATPRVDIQDFCEEYDEDIRPIIMDKVCHDKRKEVHARLDFGEGFRQRRTRECSHYSNARTLSARYHNRPERLKVRDRLRYNERHVLDRLGHRRQSAFDRLSETYSPSTTKSRPDMTSSKDRSRGRSLPHKWDSYNGDRPESKDCFRGVGESYDNSHSSYRTGINHGYHYHDRDRSRHAKRGRDSESLLSRMAAQVQRWAIPTWCHMFNSTLIGAATVWFDELPPESIYSYKDLKAAFLAYFMQQKKYVKDPAEIHNIKQKDGETIEDFMEWFKVETGRIKGAPEYIRISGFMHGVNNPELTKRLNEHVPKTMEEMMITTTAFIRGNVAAASKKKCHTSWRTRDQSKRHTSEKRSDFRGQPREGRGSSREIKFPSLETSSGTEGPLVIEAKIGGHMIHRMYVDGGSSTKILYEHCFNRLRPEVNNQMVPVTTSLTGFSTETIWPMGQLRLLVTIGDADYSTRAWMNFIIIPKEAGVPHENFKVALHPNFPYQEVAIGGTLSAKRRTELCSLLKENLNIFAWQPSDMTRVPLSVAKHRLNIREGYLPVRQKKMGQAPKRAKAIQAEDCYPLPEIDWKVESLCGYLFKCFLDAYKGYHQIQLAESDEKETAFNTGQRVYCYTKMPFGLTNAGVTYQRLVDKAFDSQIGRNIEVSTPKMYVWDSGKNVLGIHDYPERDKPCHDKTKVVLQLPSQRTIKEVQSLNEKLASLNRFHSKSAEKSLPLFKTLKKCIKKSDFYWTSESKQAFKQLKQHLSELPLLVAPKPKEEQIVYMSASYGTNKHLTFRSYQIQTPQHSSSI